MVPLIVNSDGRLVPAVSFEELTTRQEVLELLEYYLNECLTEERGRLQSLYICFLVADGIRDSTAERKKQILGLIEVLQEWDYEKFKSLLDERLSKCEVEQISGYAFVSVLFVGCTDAHDITYTLRILCHFGGIRYHDSLPALDDLPPDYLRFFNHYLKKVPELSSTVNKELLIKDILQKALIKGKAKLMKCALDLEWPSRLQPYNYLENFGFWPRRKDGVNRDSFNSVDYYKTFTCIIVHAAATCHKYDYYKEFECSLRLLWRSIPTPCLPIEDMRTYIEYPLGLTLGAPDSVNDQGWRMAMESARARPDVWSRVSDSLPEMNGDYKPRSLRHLSRCSIRRRCRSSEQIELLPLPNVLKKYVDLEF